MPAFTTNDITSITADLLTSVKKALGMYVAAIPANVFTRKDSELAQIATRITALLETAIKEIDYLITMAENEEQKDALGSFKTRIEKLRDYYLGIADTGGIIKEDPAGFSGQKILAPFEELQRKAEILTEMYAPR